MSFKSKYASSTGTSKREKLSDIGFLTTVNDTSAMSQDKKSQNGYYAYAKNVVNSIINSIDFKWLPETLGGLTIEVLIEDIVVRAIEYTYFDLKKGLFNPRRGSFTSFYWYRIKGAFFDVLKENRSKSSIKFDERLGKIYAGAVAEAGIEDEEDDSPTKEDYASAINLEGDNISQEDSKDENSDNEEDDNDETCYDSDHLSKKNSKKSSKSVTHREYKEHNEDVDYFSFSEEKAEVLEENHKIKMEYVKKIREIVQKMTPEKQRLFNLKFQFDFSDEDYQMWEEINEQKRVRDGDAYTKMANKKYGISEGYARKKICEIKEEILKELRKNKDGYSPDSYKRNTAMPGMLEFLVVRPAKPEFEMDIDNLTDTDCWDILMELNY